MKRIIACAALYLIGWAVLVPNAFSAERLFMDGFEQGLYQWGLMDPAIHWQSSEFSHSGVYAHKVQQADGSPGEFASLDFETPYNRKIYLSFWWLLINAPDTGGKLASLGLPGTGAQMEVWWTDGGHTIAVHHYDTSESLPQCSTGTSRVHYTNTVVWDNQWHHFEIFIEYNTPGVADGRLRLWIDRPPNAAYTNNSYLKVDHDDVRFVNEGPCEVYYANLRLPPDLDARMQPGALYYDDVELWDGLPTVNSTPLAPPTGLRVVQ